MTRLKNREPATDLPSTLTSPADQPSSAKAAIDKKNIDKKALNKTDLSRTDLDHPESVQLSTSPTLEVTETTAPQEVSVQKDKQKAQPKTKRQTSQWRKLGRAIKRYPNASQTLLFLMIISGTSVVLLSLLFREAWSDRYNNLAIISNILKMELNREDFRLLEDSPERVVTHTFQTLEPHVEADGWSWVNRFGNTITYGKQDQRMIASCAPYSPLYIVCDLGEIPK